MDKKKQRRENRKAKKLKQQKSRPEKPSAMNPKSFNPVYGQLPDPHIMDIIAESLHEAVETVFDELERAGAETRASTDAAKMKGRCLYYAGAGQYVASAVLGRDYCVQVGSLGVDTDSERMFKIDAADGGVAARRFHMWLVADDGGLVEFVDFTSRFFKEWAVQNGINWDREDLPPYLWGKQADIRERWGVYFEQVIEAEPEADKQYEANRPIIQVIVERATSTVTKRLLG